MVDIIEVFPITEAVGIQVNIAFSNTVLTNSSGVEQRVIKWQDPIRSFNFARKILTSTEVTTIANFYDLVKGANNSFLYQDKSDYLSNGQGYLYPAPDGSRTHFQLVKQYKVGNNIHYRPITEVNILTTIYNDAITFTGWTWGLNGEVTLVTAPPTGSLISANFSFYVPVTFDSDEFTYTLSGRYVYSVDKLLLKEIKQPPYIYPVDVLADSPSTGGSIINFPAALDYLAENQDYSDYDTEVIVLSSGFRKRTTRLNLGIFRHIFGARKTFSQPEIDTLLNFWLANKANGARFYYTDSGLTSSVILGRFNTQEITYTFTSNALVYSLESLEMRLYRGGTIPKDNPMVTPTDILSYSLMTLARICNITVPLPTGSNLVYGFTTTDRDITIDGQVYTAGTAFDPSAFEQNTSWAVNNQEIKTVINTNQISEAQLASGLFDNATITIAVVDYLNPPTVLSDSLIEQIGVTGEITASDTQFTMENLSEAASLLKQSISIHTNPYCRYSLGDSKCTVNLSSYVYTATIVESSTFSNGRRYFVVDNTSIPDKQLVSGYVLFTSGANKDLQFMIFNNYIDSASGAEVIYLNIPTFFNVSTGDTVILTAGCDKQYATCSLLYSNGINFGGERPGGNFMPNNDFYLSSPTTLG